MLTWMRPWGKMSNTAPKIVPRNIIVAGFVIFIVGAYFTGGFFPFDIKDLDNENLFNWWLSAILRDAGAILASSAIIIFGLRSIRSEGGSRRRVAMVLSGIGICTLFLVLNCVSYIQISKISAPYDFSRMISLIEFRLNQSNLPPEKRPVLARKLAESRYLQSGERIFISTENNQRELFEPPEEIIRFKKDVDHSRQLYGLIKQRSYMSIFLWTGVMLFGILIGILVPEDYSGF